MWPRGLGGAPGLVSSFPGSGLEQSCGWVGGEFEVWLAGVRERGPEDLENVCPSCWACCPWEPGLALTDGKVMRVRLELGKGYCPLLPIIFQIRELQPPACSPQYRETLCTPGLPCVALDSVRMDSLLGETLVSRSTSACRESVPSSAVPWLCSPASGSVLGTQMGDPKGHAMSPPSC